MHSFDNGESVAYFLHLHTVCMLHLLFYSTLTLNLLLARPPSSVLR